MLQMGRRRQTRLDLPPRMQFKHGSYYHASSLAPRKWTRLHTDLAKARVLWAEIENHGTNDTPLVSDLIDRWLISPNAQKLAKNTRKAYEVAARSLRLFLDGAKLSDITQTTVYSWLDNHPSPGSANTGKSLLSNVYKEAIRRGQCTTNPCADIAFRKTNERKRYITDEEYIAIWSKANPVLRVAMDLSYLTSLRISDVVKIHLSEISDAGISTIHMKTKKAQLIKMTPELKTAIDAAKSLPRTVRGMHLICTRKGQPYLSSSFNNWWVKACLSSGVKDANFHDIRAKAATDAKALGMDYQKLLGHTSAAMSERYIRRREVDQVMPLPKQIRR